MNFYDSVDVHRRMIEDATRTASFHRSIHASVKPGEVVLDVGAGTGILSLFAAQAHAARVYALERALGAARMARRLIAANGVADRVHVVEGDSDVLQAFEPVDVLVSEWLGVYSVDENMLAPVLTARDRWLKPGGTMIPNVTATWIAPVFNAAGEEATAFHSSAYGVDLSPIAPFSLDEAVWLPAGASCQDLRAAPDRLWVVDPTTIPASRARMPFVGEVTFTLDGPVNGLATWFSAEMPGTEPLTNKPGTSTHWGNFLFPLRLAGEARPSDNLHVRFECIPVTGGACEHAWSARLNEGPIEVHDTRRHRRPWGSPPWRTTFAGT